MAEILIADDERSICEALGEIVSLEGHEALVAGSAREALALAQTASPALVFLDVRLPDRSGIEVLRQIKALRPQTVVIVITAFGSVRTAMEAMRAGAFDYLGKPLDLGQVRGLLRRALRESEQAAVPAAPPGAREAQAGRPELIGQSPAMQDVFKLMSLLTENALTVLIGGESGVGKELVARGIHDHSDRRAEPFVAVNCGAIPDQLLESELFGHERGAFTGAAERRIGRFEAAGRGTLFLDEVGELPLPLQPKLLRVLQERAVERVGGNAAVPVLARVIAATNRDLAGEVAGGRFREDLFHRIHLVHLEVPPLRKRPEDIELLARHFLSTANGELGRQVTVLDPAALAKLRAHPWPGNVRELENVIKKSVLLAHGNRLTADDLHMAADRTADPRQPAAETPEAALRAAVRRALTVLVGNPGARIAGSPFQRLSTLVEQELVSEALRLTQGNQVAAAGLLGVSRTTLRKKLI
jgi:DNA-binding NtrC family response regulator